MQESNEKWRAGPRRTLVLYIQDTQSSNWVTICIVAKISANNCNNDGGYSSRIQIQRHKLRLQNHDRQHQPFPNAKFIQGGDGEKNMAKKRKSGNFCYNQQRSWRHDMIMKKSHDSLQGHHGNLNCKHKMISVFTTSLVQNEGRLHGMVTTWNAQWPQGWKYVRRFWSLDSRNLSWNNLRKKDLCYQHFKTTKSTNLFLFQIIAR